MAELSRLDAVVQHVLVFLLQMAKAIRVPRLPVVHRLSRLQTAKATRVPRRLPRALPLLRAVGGRRACLFHAQMVTAKRLTRAPVLLPAPGDRLCRGGQAWPQARDPRPLELSLDLAPGCPPRARQHELAAEHSLDFRF